MYHVLPSKMPKPQRFELWAVRKPHAPALLKGRQSGTVFTESNVTTSTVITNTQIHRHLEPPISFWGCNVPVLCSHLKWYLFVILVRSVWHHLSWQQTGKNQVSVNIRPDKENTALLHLYNRQKQWGNSLSKTGETRRPPRCIVEWKGKAQNMYTC